MTQRRWVGALCTLGVLAFCPSALGQAHQVGAARAAVSANRQDPAAALSLGRTLRRAGVYQAAVHELQRGILLPGVRSGDVAVAIRYELARVYIDQGRFHEARRACEAIRPVQGGDAMMHACLAEAHMTRKRASDALPEVEAALRVDADLYEARVVEGYARWMSGEEAKAEQVLRAASQAEQSRPEAWLALGRLHAALGRRADALQALEKAYGADPDDAVVAHELSEMLDPGPRAVQVLEGAIRSRPSFGAAHARLGEVLIALGQHERAEQEIRLALQSPSGDTDAQSLLAEVLVLRGQHEAALTAAAEALRRVPNSARAKLAQADALAAKGDIDLAIESYQAAFSFGRTSPTALVRGARVALEQQRETTARGFAERAVQEFPRWAPAWAVLGDIAVKMGEKDRARQAYDKALAGEGQIDRPRIQRALAALR